MERERGNGWKGKRGQLCCGNSSVGKRERRVLIAKEDAPARQGLGFFVECCVCLQRG